MDRIRRSKLADVARAQRAKTRLQAILEAHPEVRQRTADYLAGELPEGKPNDEEKAKD